MKNLKNHLISALSLLFFFGLIVFWQVYGYTQVINILWVIIILAYISYFIGLVCLVYIDFAIDDKDFDYLDQNKENIEKGFKTNYLKRKGIVRLFFMIDDILIIFFAAWEGRIFLSLLWIFMILLVVSWRKYHKDIAEKYFKLQESRE